MEPFFAHITFIIFLAVSSLSTSDFEEAENISDFSVNSTVLLSPLSLPQTYLRRGALPPSRTGRDGNREYKLEDFLWTGSGEGPLPADPDGGLAWEDSKDEGHVNVVVRVTQTMVLYSTVLKTLYPVELTPTVLVPTPNLDSASILESWSLSPSPSYFPESSYKPISSSETASIAPTPTMSSSIFPGVSVSVTATPPEEIPSPSPDSQPDAAASNRLYWVNTVIKANTSRIKTDSQEFQLPMQKSLARVYASAFKRHLLSSLGLMKKQDEVAGAGGAGIPNLRRKRSTQNHHHQREDLDFEWMFLKDGGAGLTRSQIQSLAQTMMNVSVSIVNITSDPSHPRVSMNYIVSAEGNPIPGSSAVQDLDLISKSEMEDEIGYEVITKAEALVTQPSSHEMLMPVKAETSPWLIVAIAAICAFVISLVGLTYLAWKSKRSAISDESPSPPPTAKSPHQGIEGGVINPAFLGSPPRIHTVRAEEVLDETSPQRKDRRIKKSEETFGGGRPDSKQSERRKFLASELNTILTKGETVLPSTVKNGTKSTNGSPDKSSDSGSLSESTKIRRTRKSRDELQGSSSRRSQKKDLEERPVSSISEKETRKDSTSSKRRRRKTGIVGHEIDSPTDNQSLTSDNNRPMSSQSEKQEQRSASANSERHRPSSAASRDKVTLGHLDICEDSIIRTQSGKVKKPSTGSGSKIDDTGSYARDKRKSQSVSSLQLPETIDEVTDLHTTTDGGEEGEEILTSLEEKDREISESMEDHLSSRKTGAGAAGTSLKKDAQVQTPTRSRGVRLKTKAKPKPRKKVPESVYMTEESEEIIDLTNIDESTPDSNPLGRMRKRFHQFLDDAFNVMGKKEDEEDDVEDEDDSRPKSAKVSISHEVETREAKRPWTTHVIHEESVKKTRPKSAGLPKRAWTDSADRRCHSAKSKSSAQTQAGSSRSESRGGPIIIESDEKHEDEYDLSSTTVPTTTSEIGRAQQRSNIPIFPHYPIYPDIPLLSVQQGPSQAQLSTDPAVPLIRAIKEEIKRFEKEKVGEQEKTTHI